MLTISSQTFRVVVVLHFTRNEELMTRRLQSRKYREQVSGSRQVLRLSRRSGQCVCGAISNVS